eukprot:1398670-Amphidinium_carterae.1
MSGPSLVLFWCFYGAGGVPKSKANLLGAENNPTSNSQDLVCATPPTLFAPSFAPMKSYKKKTN